MLLNQAGVSAILRGAVKLWEENLDIFSDIDSRFGDGDHGVAIGKIAAMIGQTVDEWDGADIKALLNKLAKGISAVGGGSAGPLYGTIFEGLADPLDDGTASVDASQLKEMLAAAGDFMGFTTKARIGDKTMMDALLPAVEAAGQCDGDIPEILAAASLAARAGAEATKKMVSKFGRARFYGEETLGTPDAGAMSTALLFQGLAAGLA